MIPLAADEDLDNRIVRGVLLRNPGVDIVTVQEAGLASKDDPEVLEWAASGDRVLLSHDVTTMPEHARERPTGPKIPPKRMRQNCTSLALARRAG